MRRLVIVALAVLTIGTATTRINLLNQWGFHLVDWRPLATPRTGHWSGGLFHGGRRQVDFRDENTTDQLTLHCRQRSADLTIRQTQNLRRILREAEEYWQPGNRVANMVYLEARAACETNARYAIVKSGRLPEDSNYYRQPFVTKRTRNAVMDSLPLVVEHGPWQDVVPGLSTCVEISGEKEWWGTSQTTSTASPGQSSDDGYLTSSTFNLSATNTVMGAFPTTIPYQSFFRFVNLAVPQGATILSASVQFRSSAADSGNECNIVIWGEDSDNAATYTTQEEYNARSITSAFALWNNIPDWALNTDYTTIDIAPIIQEVIDRSGWVSGNALALRFEDNKSDSAAYRRPYSWDDLVQPAPILSVTYITATEDRGRSATCDDEVFIANKENRAQITHVYSGTAAGVWTDQIAAGVPFNLFPAGALATNDAVVFGIDTSLADSGQFNSLVFDTGATNLASTGSPTITWQYWNGAWANLSAVVDNTGTLAFTRRGVNSVHFQQPDDWVAVDLNATGLPGGGPAGAPTGFWVMAIVGGIGGGNTITGPVTQSNRLPYTVVWPRIEINDDQTAGDIPSLIHMLLEGQSSGTDGYAPNTSKAASRVIAALRSTSRGTDFTPYINISDEQNVPGITIELESVCAWQSDSAVTSNLASPTGRRATFTPNSTAETHALTISIDAALASQYIDEFHAFMRVYANTSSDDQFVMRAEWTAGYQSIFGHTDYISIPQTEGLAAVDLGAMIIKPPDILIGSETFDRITIRIYITTTTHPTSDTLEFIDLILMPTTEWYGDFYYPFVAGITAPNIRSFALGSNRVLEIDSVENQKQVIRAVLKATTGDDDVTSVWTPAANGPAMMQRDGTQRMWFFNMIHTATTDNEWVSFIETVNSMQMYKADRYEAARGDR